MHLVGSRIFRTVDRAGHFGLFAGFYVTAAYVYFWQLANAAASNGGRIWPNPAAVVAVLLAATGVYAIDRIKLSDRLLDPADAAAQPQRYAFLTKHTARLRLLAGALIFTAMLLGMTASYILPAVIAASVLGVVIYAPGPRKVRPRPKDILIAKNFFVAAGVVCLTVAATVVVGPLGHLHGRALYQLAVERFYPLLDAAGLLLIRVMLDATLCDIEDSATDQQFGTATLATRLGERRALLIAVLGRILLGVAIFACSRSPLDVRLVWLITHFVGGLLLLRITSSLRDWVDASFLLEVCLATVAVLILRTL